MGMFDLNERPRGEDIVGLIHVCRLADKGNMVTKLPEKPAFNAYLIEKNVLSTVKAPADYEDKTQEVKMGIERGDIKVLYYPKGTNERIGLYLEGIGLNYFLFNPLSEELDENGFFFKDNR
jgi:hypothetical protein